MMSHACRLRRAEIVKVSRRGGHSMKITRRNGPRTAARPAGPGYFRWRVLARGALFVASLVTALSGVTRNAFGQTSQWVFVGEDGKLAYKTLPDGDRIMDFSFAGYRGGGVAL